MAAYPQRLRSVPSKTPIAVKPEGSAFDALRSNVGAAAKLTVEESDGVGPRFAPGSHFPAPLPARRCVFPVRQPCGERAITIPREGVHTHPSCTARPAASIAVLPASIKS